MLLLSYSVTANSPPPELILTQIESPDSQGQDAPTRSLALSRTLATPNIRYKGTLGARVVEVPDFWVAEGESSKAVPNPSDPTTSNVTPNLTSNAPKRPLIEEISSSEPQKLLSATEQKPKSILKRPGGTSILSEIKPDPVVKPKTHEEESGVHQENERPNTNTETSGLNADPHVITAEDAGREVPEWRWEMGVQGDRVVIDVPKFVRSYYLHPPNIPTLTAPRARRPFLTTHTRRCPYQRI